jgi:hypothetical protein
MLSIETAVNRILNEGIPFQIEMEAKSVAYLGLALFLSLFGALILWTILTKGI